MKRRRSERHEIKAAIILLAPKATGVTATEWTQIHAKGCMVTDVTAVVLVSSNATRLVISSLSFPANTKSAKGQLLRVVFGNRVVTDG
jgi:hypothetical protein